MMRLLAIVLLAPTLFSSHNGWHTGHGRVHACPGVSRPRCIEVESWAATIRWRGCGECLPHQTIAQLSRDGVALQIEVSVEHPLRTHAEIVSPPTITAGQVAAGFEGLPRTRGVYQRFGNLGRKEVYVWAFFGRSHPTSAQLAAANAELRTLHFP